MAKNCLRPLYRRHLELVMLFIAIFVVLYWYKLKIYVEMASQTPRVSVAKETKKEISNLEIINLSENKEHTKNNKQGKNEKIQNMNDGETQKGGIFEKMEYFVMKTVMRSFITSHMRRKEQMKNQMKNQKKMDRTRQYEMKNQSAKMENKKRRQEQVNFGAKLENENLGAKLENRNLGTRLENVNLGAKFNKTKFNPQTDTNSPSNYKKIVLYTTFYFSRPKWREYLGPRIDLRGCPESRCEFRNKASEGWNADALLFYDFDFSPSLVPKVRLPHQQYIWVTCEAPSMNKLSRSKAENKRKSWTVGFFNLTMTYHRSSDIFVPYGAFTSLLGEQDLAYPILNRKGPTYRSYIKALKSGIIPGYDLNLKESELKPGHIKPGDFKLGERKPEEEFEEEIKLGGSKGEVENEDGPKLKTKEEWAAFLNRPKIVSWMVTHCSTPSGRELYVRELRKYVSVDVYGKCGNFTCGKDHLDTYCYSQVLKPSYKFYLSFENALCEDYITEKVWLPMHYGLVPIVYGGANYSHYLPPHSYIDATILSPKKLADLLIRLAASPKEYARYHLWRNYWRILIYPPLCELCYRLHHPYESPRLYRNPYGNKVINDTTQVSTHYDTILSYDHPYDSSSHKLYNITQKNYTPYTTIPPYDTPQPYHTTDPYNYNQNYNTSHQKSTIPPYDTPQPYHTTDPYNYHQNHNKNHQKSNHSLQNNHKNTKNQHSYVHISRQNSADISRQFYLPKPPISDPGKNATNSRSSKSYSRYSLPSSFSPVDWWTSVNKCRTMYPASRYPRHDFIEMMMGLKTDIQVLGEEILRG